MVCPVQEHSKQLLAGVLNMWRRHYGGLLFGNIVKHIVDSIFILTLGTTLRGLNKTDRSDVGGDGGNSKI